MNSIEVTLDALHRSGCNPRKTGSGWKALCPAHADSNPSLSVAVGEADCVLLHCHAGCSYEEVITALGLRTSVAARATMAPGPNHGDGDESLREVTSPQRSVASEGQAVYSSLEAAVQSLKARLGVPSGRWSYVDETGDTLGWILRWNTGSGKTIRPVSRCADGWRVGGMEEPRPLYCLDDLAKAKPGAVILVAEGEKAADALRDLGFLATTSPHGAQSASKADWTPLRGRDVVIVPDNDEAGERYASDVMKLAASAGAAQVRTIYLTEAWPELPVGGDAFDLVDADHADPDLLRSKILSLIDEAGATSSIVIKRPVFQGFPADVLPEPIQSFVREASAAVGCDQSYLAVPLLASLASAIGTSRQVRIKESWTEPAILWTAVIGESGTAKSPALELATRPVKDHQRRTGRNYQQQLQQYERETAKTASADETERDPRPLWQRTWTSDITPEALVSLLKENPRGLLASIDELGLWLEFGRYSAGRRGDAARWIAMFHAREVLVDRKGSGVESVPCAAVSIAGGIQPGILRRMLSQDLRDSGLAARLLFAAPPRAPRRYSEADISSQTQRRLDDVFEALYALEPACDFDGEARPRNVDLDTDARREFRRFIEEHREEQASREGDEAAAWSKLEAYVLRIALVLHAVRSAANDPSLSDPQHIDEASLAAAIIIVRWFANEADRVYRQIDDDETGETNTKLLAWITAKGSRVTARDLARGPRAYRSSAREAEAALQALVDQRYGTWEWVNHEGAGGRPAKQFVLGATQHSGDTMPAPAIASSGTVAVAVAGAPAELSGSWGVLI